MTIRMFGRLFVAFLLCLTSSAMAQVAPPRARPPLKGRVHRVRVDSSPQQAAVYWDAAAGATSAPRAYGIAGYTPIELKVPHGRVKLIVELKGFKTIERELDVAKSQPIALTLERAAAPARLDLRAGSDGSAAGGDVFIDGVVKGTLPNAFDLPAGRHQVEVRKAGYKSFSDWIELGDEERRTRDVTLERAETGGGSILITSDSGGDVYVDGTRKDAVPAMIAGVAPGEHVVEVRKEGLAPWRQTVTVVAGQQVKVTASLGAGGAGGSLRVMATEPDVDVYVDGKLVGKTPAEVHDVRPGQHVVEGRKAKFRVSDEIIKLTPGEELLVRLKAEPAPDDRPRAILRVQSTVPNAEVFLDGASLGRAPIDRSDLEPGPHYLMVRRDGFVEFKREVKLVANTPMAIVADLRAVANLKFLSSPDGAQVFIDGEPISGKTPNQREEVSAGEHQILFRKSGYVDAKQTIKVEGGRERIVAQDLVKAPTGPPPDQVQRWKQGMSSFGARALPAGGFTADFGMGWPYLFVGRLTVSTLRQELLSIDAGVEFRTYFQMNEFDLHGRVQFLELGPLSLAAKADIGGGIGPNGRNAFFMDVGPAASLSFNDIVTFTGHARLSYWNDRLCPSPQDKSRGVDPRGACTDYKNVPGFAGKDPEVSRFADYRFYVGGSLEVAINRLMTAFLMMEFLPFQYDERLAFTDTINSVQLDNDPLAYGMAGVTFKF